MVSSATALAATESVKPHRHPPKPVQVVAVTGGKGGVGKSVSYTHLTLPTILLV